MAIEARLADGRILRFPDGTNPEVVDTTVQNLLAEDKATPTKKPTQAAQPEAEYDFGSPLGTGSEEIMAQPNRERKAYTGSVFDTQPFEPEFNPAEAARLSRREYAEATTKPPRRTQYVQATPKEQIERTIGQAALDTTIGLLQGAAGVPKTIASNINAGDNPVARFYEEAIQAGERSKSPYLQSQKAEREAFIKNVIQNQGEVAGARASFTSLFSPAGADIVSQGAGSMVPTLGMSLLGLGQRAMTAVNALSVAGEAAQNTAQKLSQMSPENWSNSSAYQELRSTGMSHKDAVNMLAPLFALPPQMLGLVVGGVSGSTGLEKTLAGKSITGGAKERAARAGAELLGEEAETLIPSFVANATQRIFDDKQSLIEGLGKEAVETAAGTVPGAAIAASGRAGKPRVNVAPVTAAPPTPQQQVITPEQERVEPTFDEAAFVQQAQAAAPTAPAPTPVAETAAPTEQVKAIAERLQKRGISRKAALAMAEREVQANEPAPTERGGATNVAEPISEPTGEGVSVAGQPSAEPPTGGVAGVEPSGVVPTGQAPTGVTAGERVEPPALADPLAKYEGLYGATRAGAIQGEIALNKKLLATAQKKGDENTGLQAQQEIERLSSLLPEAAQRDQADARNSMQRQMLGSAKEELDTAVDQGVITPDAAEQLISEAQKTGDAAAASELIHNAIDTSTEGAQLGIETPEAIEATQKGQEAPAAGAVEATKRGRKPAPVEVKEQKKLTRNEQNRINNDADYNLKKYVAQLGQTLTPKQIEELSFEEAEQAEIDARQSRRSALRGLIELQDNPNIARGSAVGKRISAAIKNSKATEAELADIRRGIKAAKDVLTGPKEDVLGSAATPSSEAAVAGRPTAMRSSEAKVGKADKGFDKVTTGAQAVTYITKTGNAFQKLVAQRIRNYMAGVKFVVVEKGDPMPDQLRGARGLFEYTPETGERTIYVRGSSFGNMQGINAVTVLHELLHAATASRIAAGTKEGAKNAQLQKFVGEMQAIMKRAQEAYEEGVMFGELSPEIQDMIESKVDINEKTGKPTFLLFDDPNEFLAYGMSSPTFQKFLMSVEGTQKEETAFSKFVRAILDLFGLGNGNFTALSDLVNITDKMLGTEVTTPSTTPQTFQQTQDERTQKEKEKAVNHAFKVVDRSFEAEQISEQTEVLQRLRSLDTIPLLQEAAEGLDYAQKQAIAKIFSTPLIAEIGGVNVPELINTNRLLEQLDASKMRMLRAGAKTINDIKRLVPTEQSRKKVSYAAHVFTVSKIDPRVDTSVAKINNLYNALTPNEKQALDEIVNVYSDFADHLDFILEENAKALRPAEAQKLIAAVREVLGKDNRIPFYVTLARDQDGKYWLRAGPGEFYTRKTRRERNRLAKALAKERNTSVRQLMEDKEIEMGDDIEVLRKKVLDSSDALRKLFIMIDDADFTAEEHGASLQKAKDGMKDSVFQLWLHMQPESSARKQFIHRSAMPPAGFRTDVIQNLAESILKFANHATRLEYAPQLRRSISQANASIAERPEYTPYVSEMALRVNNTLAPDNQSKLMSATRFSNSFTFGYYMSESSAVLQLLSLYQVGTAQLIKHYPVAAVAKEMKTMGAVWNTMGMKDERGDWVTPTIEQALNVKDLPSDTPAERLRKEQDRALIDAMIELDVPESTATRDLTNYKNMPTGKYDSKYEKAKRVGKFVVSGLIHTTERMSRELMFMSSAHLARDKAVAEFRKTAEYKNAPDKIAAERAFGEANIQKWAERAAKDTDLALFNYSESAKPRYMRNALGKFALQFFTYQLNIGSFILRNLLGIIKPLPGETRTECLRAFATLMGTTWTLGGVSATFGVPILFGFASAVMKGLKDPDEPDELKDIDNLEAYKVWLYEQLGDVTIGGKSLAKIIDQGPINAFAGIDVSSRTSLSNILTPPEVKDSKTPREGVLGYAQLIGGPNLQAILSVADGVDLFIKGEHYRGVEKMMPWATVRNKMTAFRQYTEGEKGLKLGDDVVESELFYTGELVGQAVGLRPVILSDVAAANRKAREIVGKVVDQRAKLLDQIDRADRKGDVDESIAAREAKDKFNVKYSGLFPKLVISNEDVSSFKEGRNKARSKSFGGFEYTPQNKIVAEQVTDRSREALIKREKEIAERKRIELSGMAK